MGYVWVPFVLWYLWRSVLIRLSRASYQLFLGTILRRDVFGGKRIKSSSMCFSSDNFDTSQV